TGLLALAAGLRMAVVIGAVLLWLGKLGFRDIGLAWERVPSALLLAVLTWLLAQAIALVAGVAASGEVRLDAEWQQRQLLPTFAALATHLLTVSLYEEVAYRGYLLPQFFLILVERWKD